MKTMSKMVLIFSKVKNKNIQLIEKALRWKSQVGIEFNFKINHAKLEKIIINELTRFFNVYIFLLLSYII